MRVIVEPLLEGDQTSPYALRNGKRVVLELGGAPQVIPMVPDGKYCRIHDLEVKNNKQSNPDCPPPAMECAGTPDSDYSAVECEEQRRAYEQENKRLEVEKFMKKMASKARRAKFNTWRVNAKKAHTGNHT